MNASHELAVRLGIAQPDAPLEMSMTLVCSGLLILMVKAMHTGVPVEQIIARNPISITDKREEIVGIVSAMTIARRSGKPPIEFFALVAQHMLSGPPKANHETNKDLN